MTTTPDIPIPDDDPTADSTSQPDEETPGAEIGMSEGEGSSFEPEEDPEA